MTQVFNLQGFCRKTKIASAIALTFTVSSVTWAQQQDEQTIKNNAEKQVEVLTVTAQKRVQNILKVPVSVGTVSANTIEQSSSVQLSDVDKFIPGFDFSDANVTQAGVTMRGISSPNISVGGDPSTATFWDDVYLPRAAQNVMFSDMARIEVLKGPQGTLFGRNAAMGVVNMVPNSPSDEREGFIKAHTGTDNLKRLEGMFNLPLTDNFFARLNFLSNQQDGFIKNTAKPTWNQNSKIYDLGEIDHQAARLALLWQLSDSTKFQLAYDWDNVEQAPPMAVGVSEFAYQQGTDIFADKLENDVREGVEKRDMYGITAKLMHDINSEWSAKAVASYRDWQTVNREDEDGTADITRYFDTSNNEDSNIFYAELQFNYTADRINAVMGMTYSKEDVSQTTELNLTTNTAARLVTGQLNDFIKQGVAEQLAGMIGGTSDDLAAANFGPGVTFAGAVDTFYALNGFPMEHLWHADEWANALNTLGFGSDIMTAIGMPGMPLTADIVNATGDLTYDIVANQLGIAEIFGPSVAGTFWQETVNNTGKFTNLGLYGDLDYALTDDWHVIAGLRYSKDDKDFTWYIPPTSFAATRPGVGNLLFPISDLAANDSWSKITGRLVTSYQVTDTDMLFASFSTGYKSGGFDSLVPNSQAFKPEDTQNIEIGYKGIINNQLVANVSAYYLQLDNLQKTVDSKAPGSSQAIPTIINEDRDIAGLELDLQWQVTDTVKLGAVSEIRSTKAKTPSFYNGDGELIAADELSSHASINYTINFEWLPDFSVGTTTLHLDYVFVENQNDQEVGLEDYKKAIPEYFRDQNELNGRISWRSDNDKFELGLWTKNLFDNRYMISVGGLTADVLGTPHGRINRGRELGVDVKYNF